jgi:toxin YoeB
LRPDLGKLWTDEAWEEYLYWQTQDKKTLKKLNSLIKDIQRHPFEGIGKPEPLKENLSGWWSRQIDEKNRIVYRIEKDNIIISQCRGHY